MLSYTLYQACSPVAVTMKPTVFPALLRFPHSCACSSTPSGQVDEVEHYGLDGVGEHVVGSGIEYLMYSPCSGQSRVDAGGSAVCSGRSSVLKGVSACAAKACGRGQRCSLLYIGLLFHGDCHRLLVVSEASFFCFVLFLCLFVCGFFFLFVCFWSEREGPGVVVGR